MIEKLKKIADYFPYCLTIVDVKAEGRPCIFVNEMYLDNTGYNPDEAIGRNLSYLQGELTSSETIEFMRECFKDGLCCIQDIVNYKKDGTPFLNRLLMLPIRTKSDELLYVGFQNDITEMRGLNYNNASLKRVNDAEIKHMVNNPLTIILGTMMLAFKQDSSEEEIAKAAELLSDTFQQINEYALNIEDVSEFENYRIGR